MYLSTGWPSLLQLMLPVDWLVITVLSCLSPDEDIDTRKQVKLSRRNVPHTCF